MFETKITIEDLQIIENLFFNINKSMVLDKEELKVWGRVTDTLEDFQKSFNNSNKKNRYRKKIVLDK